MATSIVYDGRERLEKAQEKDIRQRRAELLRAFQAQFEASLQSASPIRQWWIRLKIRWAVQSALRREFPRQFLLYFRQ